jgi:hypothetical protein
MKIASAFARRVVRRRTLLKATAVLVFTASPAGLIPTVGADDRSRPAGAETEELRMTDAPRTPTTKVTVERRAQIVLRGIAPLARANESVDELAAFLIRAACVWPAVYGPVTVVRDGDR